MKVYEAINAVQGALAKTGISKDRRATGGGASYSFRGIDDVYAALSPLMAEHKLCIIPRIISRECTERQSRNGGALFYVAVHAEFDFVSAEDGSKHTAATYGEAMDSSDKATNKAMSAAYKYAAFLTFAIPTEGDHDTEAESHDVTPPTINDAQWAAIVATLEQADVPVAKLLAAEKVDSVNQIRADRYEPIMKKLNLTIDKKLAEKDVTP
jgi:ERF superfamily